MILMELRGRAVRVTKQDGEILLLDGGGKVLNWRLTAEEFADVSQAIASHGDAEFFSDADPHG